MSRDILRTARRAAVALTILLPACTPMDNALQSIFGRSMQDQSSFDPYENPRMPPEHAISFASGNYPAAAFDVGLGQSEGPGEAIPPFTAMDMATGGETANTLVNPVPASPESLQRGQVMYDRMCSICHGPEGDPAQAAILPKLPLMVAFPLATGIAPTRSDGYLYGMIRAGRGVMPAYGYQVSNFDRWHIVNYVRQLQRQAAAGATAGDQ